MARNLTLDDLVTMIADLHEDWMEKQGKPSLRSSFEQEGLKEQEKLKTSMIAIGEIRHELLGGCPPGYHECGAGCCSDLLEADLCKEVFLCGDPQVHPAPGVTP
jgi:hypothetical protein